MEAKSRSSIKTSKTAAEKKEPKEPNNPTAKKTMSETVPVSQDGAKSDGAESQGVMAPSENKGHADEQDTSNGGGEGSGYESLKPVLLAVGVTVAALAVIVGVVFLARKK
ncbi:hypothetical protein GDO86_008644 [Hymenochirus boettgeri]|uniref:Cell cycle exit and neuronal differentiation protein 1 n=1 Tax=Hymenochirus boettgeri TaxID=247094 RepID=A0A8T2J6L8_9PIPI|nr:hypothetical protein GDO86_008644 [Hymenochirus boettgeri]